MPQSDEREGGTSRSIDPAKEPSGLSRSNEPKEQTGLPQRPPFPERILPVAPAPHYIEQAVAPPLD